MILTAEHFKGSQVSKSLLNTNDVLKKSLDDKFSKGAISAELYYKELAKLNGVEDNLEKGEIMDRLGYGYGNGSEPIKFTKTGKELKDAMPSVIAKLTEQRTVLVGQMSGFKIIAGIEPSADGRYDWKTCETYDEVSKQYLTPTNEQKACRSYNDCLYQLKSIDEDIRACQAIMTGVNDKQTYNLTISQLVALNIDNALKKAVDEDDLEKGGEGSKGGKVVGHTKSGKPIYDSSGMHADAKKHYDEHHKKYSEMTDSQKKKYRSMVKTTSEMSRSMHENQGNKQEGDVKHRADAAERFLKHTK